MIQANPGVIMSSTILSLNSMLPNRNGETYFQNLPKEILGSVLTYLKPLEIQYFAPASKEIKVSIIQLENIIKPSELRRFIENLILKINQPIYQDQAATLHHIKSSLHTEKFPNLLLLKGKILSVKNQLFDVLKTLDEVTLDSFNLTIPVPDFFENIFQIAKIYKKIAPAKNLLHDQERARAFHDISIALAQAGDIQRAIEATFINASSGPQRQLAIRELYKTLTNTGNIGLAIKLIHTAIPKDLQEYALQDISKFLIEAGNVQEAIQVTNTIQDKGRKSHALAGIAEALAQAGEIDKAIEVANTILDEAAREGILFLISMMR